MVTSERRKWLALGLLSVVQFMVVLDIAIVNVALPSIKVDLGFSQENLQWVISAYALVFGGFLLLGGRAADLLGRRRLFLVAIVVFTLASLFAGLAWSETSLIGARALQGLGAAIITPAALSILSTTFVEGRERNIALGAWGAVGGFGAAAGLARRQDAGLLRYGAGLARELRRLGAPALRATDALRHPADPDPERRKRRRLDPRHRDVRDVPDADPVHAAGPGLLADEDRPRLSRGGGNGHPLVGGGGAARHADRRQAGAADRHDSAHGRPRVLHAGLRPRLVRR